MCRLLWIHRFFHSLLLMGSHHKYKYYFLTMALAGIVLRQVKVKLIHFFSLFFGIVFFSLYVNTSPHFSFPLLPCSYPRVFVHQTMHRQHNSGMLRIDNKCNSELRDSSSLLVEPTVFLRFVYILMK